MGSCVSKVAITASLCVHNLMYARILHVTDQPIAWLVVVVLVQVLRVTTLLLESRSPKNVALYVSDFLKIDSTSSVFDIFLHLLCSCV